MFKILLIGDIVGRCGQDLISKHLPVLKEQHQIQLCVANAENASGGLGIDAMSARHLQRAGVDLMTLGNHAWAKQGWIKDCDDFPNICRPLNGPPSWPGFDHVVSTTESGVKVLLINLHGQVFNHNFDNPFVAIEQKLDTWRDKYCPQVILVDFHAEATAEKIAMGYYLQDRVSVVFGTHTHVQTADERILGAGTAYITDLGMTGPGDGIIGMSKNAGIRRFAHSLPARYEVETQGASTLQGAIVSIDETTGRAQSIERLMIWE